MITEQGPALPATLLPALQELLTPPWGTGEASAAFLPRTQKSWAPLHRHQIFLRAARKYNFSLMRASRSLRNLALLRLAGIGPSNFG
jgi:hypothetical protein